MPKQDIKPEEASQGTMTPPQPIQPHPIQPHPEKSQSSPVSSQAQHKRRRVTRACDECRKKKVKCDGKQPCIHCTVYSYTCTYQQPNIRNKKSSIAPQQSSLGISSFLNHAGNPTGVVPGNSPFVANSQLGMTNALGSLSKQQQSTLKGLVRLLLPKLNIDENPQDFNLDKFERVFKYLSTKNSGSLPLNELSELYMDGPSKGIPIHEKTERQSSVSSMDDTPSSLAREHKIILPPKEVALNLIYTTWNKACVLFRFYHRPSLLEEVELLYSIDPSNYTDRQQKFLPFMYSILATGSLFSKSTDNHPTSNDSLEDDGFRYFMAARKLIDITNVGDIISIQTIVMMVLYLQCSARLSTCYSYIGIALRSSLKEGLHRNLSIFQNSKKNKLTPIEIDTRKRLFYTIYKMDIYINSLLGLPRSIQEEEFDQELPEDLDDENITVDDIKFSNQVGLSSSGCANHHTKLMLIISHIVKDLYPIKNKGNSEDRLTPEYTHARVTEIELELKTWLDNLPKELKPTDPNVSDSGKDIPQRFVLANCYLHLAFLNCQIMLYRPFIHFISTGSNIRRSDPRSLIRGRNCIKVARMVVKLANKMIDQNLLVGTYWFSMYTIFFSIACLIYYFHFANYRNASSSGVNYAGVLFDDDLNIDMIKKDIEVGKKVLDCLKNNSNSSLRIFNILNNLFEQLNRRTATSSRGNTSVSMIQHESNVDDFMHPVATQNNKTLESTFYNFDSMNNFQHPNPEHQQTIQEPIKLMSPDLVENDGNKVSESKDNSIPVSTNFPRVDASKLSEPLSHPISASSETPITEEYMPGVIDKLDAQIFGRILPPYMLEPNAKYATINKEAASLNHGKNGSENKFDETAPPSYNTENPHSNPINYEDFDFLMLDDAGTIDHLDPFNPQYHMQMSP
ncbi:activator of stress genes 1 [[Candida] anglica]|uniref:Activator of stress genes 1 n=1 Tax=[Candida] anglica TaxID=148631 RepID=A0ABP0E8E6_9ASCO